MLFNSFHFIIFFPIVFDIYLIIPHRFRWALLLASSYYFYMAWKPEYIILIILSTCIDYFVCIEMGKEKYKKKRKKYLYISLFSNLGLLFIFKYFNFLNESLKAVFVNFNVNYNIPNFELLLPMGISFYTFQTLSYTIDVYRGKIQPEKHFGIFALYVSFFPQLVAGPIERSDRLLPQFYKKYTFNYDRVTSGLKRMVWGFFKKIVIADRLAILVNSVYNNPLEYEGFQLIIATVFFAFQIFCDFSGYADIAIGSAQILGFNLMENFKRPYFSKTISEFWKRWHISLSLWFRDYLYIPLGGNRVGIYKNYFNLFFTFLISGLWHGANWTFLAWGALHGLYLVLEKLTVKIRMKITKFFGLHKFPFIHKCTQVTITFSLVCFAWIFFRANSLGDALYIIKSSIMDINKLSNLVYIKDSIAALGLSKLELAIAILSILIMESIHLIQRRKKIISLINKRSTFIRWSLYYCLLIYIIFFAVTSTQEFIYFQF